MTLSFSNVSLSGRAQTSLSKTTSELAQTFERLSSGLRINSAADDPAGLQLADKLRADSTLANQASRNANDGLSAVSVADSGLENIGFLLTRMSELATQSANGTYSNSQRSALSAEFVALGSEIERVARTTTFNNQGLLSASSSMTLQVGLDGTANSRITVQAVQGTLASLGLASSGSSSLTFSIIDVSTAGAQYSAQVALDNITAAINSLGVARGTLGAASSRLSSAIDFLTVVRENYAAAESKIRDADVAEEVAKMVRLQVLQQAATAVLAQANLQPERALELLQ